MSAASSEVIEVTPLGGTRLHLRFSDGVAGVVDIASMIRFEGVFAPLSCPEFFAKVSVDPTWGTICWPGDLDLAPEPLHGAVTRPDAE